MNCAGGLGLSVDQGLPRAASWRAARRMSVMFTRNSWATCPAVRQWALSESGQATDGLRISAQHAQVSSESGFQRPAPSKCPAGLEVRRWRARNSRAAACMSPGFISAPCRLSLAGGVVPACFASGLLVFSAFPVSVADRIGRRHRSRSRLPGPGGAERATQGRPVPNPACRQRPIRSRS